VVTTRVKGSLIAKGGEARGYGGGACSFIGIYTLQAIFKFG